jgi:heparosan-N-sulfate-glucuronate 5-epimerase
VYGLVGLTTLTEQKPENNLRSRVKARLYWLRLGPGAPNVFGSESSFEPPIGHNWAPGERPRGYYIDFRVKNESPRWPPYWMEARRKQFGVTNAQWGLGAFERYLDGEGEEWLTGARDCADHIVANLQEGGPRDGAWLHLLPMPHTFPLNPPWVSAMAQGEIASLLTRIHLETGEERYAEAALRAVKTLRLPVSEGGTLAEVDGHPVLEEYPTARPSAVLNGAIFAMWGLYDVGTGLDDAAATEFFEATTTGLAALIDLYDAGYWSRYDLYPHRLPNLASPSYHLLHIRQLTALDRLSPRPQLAAAVERFESYRSNLACRRRAMAEKVAFRLVVPRNRIMARVTGAARNGSTPGRSDQLVLCYHAISETWTADLSIAPVRLREHLEYLARRGYRGVTFSELVAGAEGKVVAVTFDDGYRSVVELALPIRSELDFPGTLFVPTDYIGSDQPMSWPGIEQWLDTEHEPELLPMTWNEVRQLRDAGWEIGSHTRSHPKLTELDAAHLADELTESRRRCESQLGSCGAIAYPYGDHDEAVIDAARAAGYSAAATLPDGSPPPRPLAWPRIGVYNNDDMRSFRLKVSSFVRRARGSSAWPFVAGGLRSLKQRVVAG